MRHNDCHHSLLIPLRLAYFWLLFSNGLILIWTTCMALELIKPGTPVVLAQCLQRALAHCTTQLSIPPVCILICTRLGFTVHQSALCLILKKFQTSFSVLSSSYFFLPPTHPATHRHTHRWIINGASWGLLFQMSSCVLWVKCPKFHQTCIESVVKVFMKISSGWFVKMLSIWGPEKNILTRKIFIENKRNAN